MTSATTNAKPRPFALVTGASAGIGVAFAHELARRGHDLALVARRLDRLEQTAADLRKAYGVDAVPIAADLSIVDAHRPIMDALAAHGREVDVLVNNAGYSLPKTYVAHTWEQQRDFIMTLVVAVSGLTHAVLPGMMARRSGSLIFVGSIAGLSPGGAGHTLYPAAKSYVHKFALSLDAEVRAKGVKVTCVHPGSTSSEFQIANGMSEIMTKMPRSMVQTAEAVVRTTLAANNRGKVIVVPGLHNKAAAALMKYLPDAITAPLIRSAAEKYRMAD
jgi:short-subunit dehydrogenase